MGPLLLPGARRKTLLTDICLKQETVWPQSEGRDLVPLGFRSDPEGSCLHFRLAGSRLGGPLNRGRLAPLAVLQLSFSATWVPCSVQSLGSVVSHTGRHRGPSHRDLAKEERGRAQGCSLALVCAQRTQALMQLHITHTSPHRRIGPGSCHTQEHTAPLRHTGARLQCASTCSPAHAGSCEAQ